MNWVMDRNKGKDRDMDDKDMCRFVVAEVLSLAASVFVLASALVVGLEVAVVGLG